MCSNPNPPFTKSLILISLITVFSPLIFFFKKIKIKIGQMIPWLTEKSLVLSQMLHLLLRSNLFHIPSSLTL